jgi:sulfide:quinone oxidoreductase
MARVLVLGAGVSGHTAALFAKKRLGSSHEVVVVSPNSKWNWIPSNIWVGVGRMKPEDVIFDLAPVYAKQGITFKQARALSIHPDGESESDKPFVTIEYTQDGKVGESEKVEYDYLINATGPKLNFAATEGLGPDHNSLSVCTYGHAEEANKKFQESIEKMRAGQKQRFLIGTGHGMCTCQGAAFEYIFNIDHELRNRGVRDKAELIWISNEYELGDFGVAGMHIKRGGYITNGKIFAESLFTERDLHWITRAHVTKVEPGVAHYESLDGSMNSVEFDFAMLIPPFAGSGMKAFGKDGSDISSEVFAPNTMMKVDADYTPKPFEEWSAKDWPRKYQSPRNENVFACGIAFAPPHPISKPQKSPNGTMIVPTPPRTGMPSAIMGKAVAMSIADMIDGAKKPTHEISMAEMGAACVASAGKGLFNGTAASMTMYPVVPDFEKYPEYGRDVDLTTGEIGTAGHWIKEILHYMFIYKAKAKPLWYLIPE